MELSKKAIFFSMDALFAAMLILGGFFFIYQMTVTENPTDHIDYLSKDILIALDQIPVSTINHTFVQQEIANGNITDPDNSILEQIAEYWARNENAKAEQLTNITLGNVIPSSLGIRIRMKPDLIYEQFHSTNAGIVASRRMVSGIEKGKPLQGSSSYGYLRNIKDKRSSAYAYFGGFIGQGNITVQLEELPSDVNNSRIRSIIFEADLKRDSTISINDVHCMNLTPSGGNMTADLWDLSSCNGSLVPGINNFTLFFESLNNAYIGGGYIRVDYETDVFQINRSYEESQQLLPEVEGIINLFDSFYVPGQLNELSIYLHYIANHTNITNNTFYLTVGDTLVYADTNSTGVVITTLTDAYLSSVLNYTLLANSTVPFRLGFENLTYNTIYTGNADVSIITDVSGSMDWNFTHDWSSSTQRNCDNPFIYDLSTQRLSVAKCLDKDFAVDILNVTGNRVGLVSYESSTDSTLALSTNITTLYNEIGMGTGAPVGYVANGGTCICCGINSALNQLSGSVAQVTLITSQSDWNYTNASFNGQPQNDSQNRTWYDPNYSLESGWQTGAAVIGHDAGIGGIAVDTEIGSNLTGSSQVVDLWELQSDTTSPEADFTNGLNSTANTYGIAAANDGWDWSSGTFDYASSFQSFGVVNQRLQMRTPNSGTTDTSGSYAVTVNITQQQYDTIISNGTALLSFDYWWDDYNNYYEEWQDQVWLKGRWNSPYSGAHYLGTQQDDDHSHSDASPEIFTRDNPNWDVVDQHFSQDISTWIEGPGLYYLELGGKLLRSASNEWGYFRYDNILLMARNNTDHYYFRKHFTISDMDDAQRGVLNVLSDDNVAVYVNGNLIFDDRINRNASYWDNNGYEVLGSHFVLGDNVIAAELRNDVGSARFDLELIGLNDSQKKVMMLMTDGDANQECAQQGITPDLDGDGSSDTASDDAIQAACEAAQEYAVTIYAVGFSENANEDTLDAIAICGNGLYKKSNDVAVLQMFYQDVVLNILEVSRKSQSVIIAQGSPSDSKVYGDSYVLVNYSSVIIPPEPNEIELVFQTPQFNACTANITIPPGLRVVDSQVTSYSDEHWTSLVQVDNNTVFNLSEFASNYTQIGHPFIVHVPAQYLDSGTHTITVLTGDDDQNTTGCSLNNSLIYKGFVNSSTTRSTVVEKADGCEWTVEFEDGNFLTFDVPSFYTGARTCLYTNASYVYDKQDAYDLAVYNLLSQLDFDKDGRVFVNLAAEDLEIIVTLVSDIPYLWGPAIMEVELWQ